MTFILVPNHGEDIQINGWNWRPTLELLRANGLVEGEMYERMGAQGCGGAVDARTAERFAEVIDAQLQKMRAGDRMLADFTVTSTPKSYRADAPDVYSATYEWLTDFSAFCRRCGGFEVT